MDQSARVRNAVRGELRRILLVEDEPDIQSIARLALETLGGYRVEVCGSGPEALERVGSIRPDLILLDVMMPGMDGPAVVRELRSRPETAGYPVVFMTAKVQPQELNRYLEMGALGVIAKPFDPMVLSDELRRLWEGGGGGQR